MLKISRVITILIAGILLLELAACSGDSAETEADNKPSQAQNQEGRKNAQADPDDRPQTLEPARRGNLGAALSRALAQQFNLAPRCQRGDNQDMFMEVFYHYLDGQGVITAVKRNEIQYDQLCLRNSQDSLAYQIRIDSLKSGAKQTPGSKSGRFSVSRDFDGYSFELEFSRRMGTRNGCYAHRTTLADNMQHTAAFEFLSMFLRIELVEQIRYTAAASLMRIGDSLTVPLPGPICYQIPKVIKEFRSEQQPYHLTFSGITQYGPSTCAIVEIESQPSPLSIEFAATEGTWTGSGSTWFSGEFLVSLDNGDIVRATLRERMVATQKYPDGSTAPNPVVVITELRQIR